MSQATEGSTLEVIGLILAVVIVALILFPAMRPFLHSFNKELCDSGGKQTWEKLKPVFDNLDKENTELFEVLIVKGKCDLVTFTPQVSTNIQLPSTHISELPQICMCSLDENKCEPLGCYKFEKINHISPFTTRRLPKHINLLLQSTDNRLDISSTYYLRDQNLSA